MSGAGWERSLVEEAILTVLAFRGRMTLRDICDHFRVDADIPNGGRDVLRSAIINLVAAGYLKADGDQVLLNVPDLHDPEALEAWLNDR